ncbi:MAG: hypothetical protein JW718_02650 [Desulfovibrionaceae bacterium]|nr:hypothetical protein [Desulfovibrionaceae bacterium]
MAVQVENIEIHMGPQQAGAPDDLLKTIVGFIDGARKSLDIAVQEIDSREIAGAIIRAKQGGVKVRVVLEADYLTVPKFRPDPFEQQGTNELNRQLHDAILRSAIKVNSDFNPKIFHQKFIIRDGKSLLTGSTNFTTTGVSRNLNHVIVIHDEKIAKIYGREYREIQQGHFGRLNEGHDRKPKVEIVSGVPIKVLFAPDHDPEMEIAKQMAKARERIDFAIFTFAESSAIDDQMLLAARADIKIKGNLDAKQANQKWAASKHLLNQTNIDIRQVPNKAPVGKLHHKLMVIDRQVIIAGSFNYTGPANLLNDENILVIGDHGASDPTARANQQRLADFVLGEIERIYTVFGRPIPQPAP